MAAVTFDTLKFVKTLQAAGVSMPQAEAFASAVRDSTESADLATKADLRELKAELKADMRELELRMTVKLGSMLVVAVGVIVALNKLL
ncbi:MAG: CCDC90 family protein [Burkholderiaceae bacterium]|jgi:DNA-binding transcriptional MerR regulator|nr:CCDC90 family protein [Burkholderiaceae bacterium]